MNYCKHGKRLLSQPVRKCQDCEYEEEIEHLEQQLEKAREALKTIQQLCLDKTMTEIARQTLQDIGD